MRRERISRRGARPAPAAAPAEPVEKRAAGTGAKEEGKARRPRGRRDLSGRRGGRPGQKTLSGGFYRALAGLAFMAMVLGGLAWHTGWGTLSSFGWRDIAAVCPLGGFEVMLAEMTLVPRALIGILAVAVLCAVLGRVFCGWLCPVPLTRRIFGLRDSAGTHGEAAQAAPAEAQAAAMARPAAISVQLPGGAGEPGPRAASDGEAGPARPGASGAADAAASRARSLEDAGPFAVLAGALASSAVFGFPVFCLVCPVGLTFALVIGLWRLFEFNELSWSIGFFAFFIFLELFVLRRWCHRFCPLGAMMTLLARANSALGLFRPTPAPSKCLRHAKGLDCRVCGEVCPEGIDVKGISSGMLGARCTKCRICADACPTHAIHFPAFERRKAAAAAAGDGIAGAMKNPAAPLSRKRAVPVRLAPEKRRTSFTAVEKDLAPATVIEQSARCIECGACTKACPQGNDIASWMKLLKAGNVRDAAEMMLRSGSIPEVCGRVCPSERLCESACPLAAEGLGGAVPISAIERAVSDIRVSRGWQPRAVRGRRRRAVAVIGAGPAGLSCADMLARKGAKVTVYERDGEAGGLLTYGIPAFKLEKSVITRRRRILRRLGVRFLLGREAGGSGENAVPFEEILASSDAVFVAVGAEVPVVPEMENAGAEGVMQARDYLRAAAEAGLGRAAAARRKRPEQPAALAGRKVLVIGAGDTAVDCLRSAIRQGAASAAAIARKPEGQLRALPEEVLEAREEGASFITESVPKRVLADEAGRVRGLEIESVATGERREVEGDLILLACGFHAEAHPWLAGAGVTFSGLGRIETDGDGRTANPRVYAGGDAVRGAALAVTAIADGRRAAAAIMRDLGLDAGERARR